MTAAEARAFNAGVRAVLAIAEQSAAAIARSERRIPMSFAREALAGLAQEARNLIIDLDETEPTLAKADRTLIVDERTPVPDLQFQAPR